MARRNYKRNSMGRQKIRMVKMENANNLQVTFSKRRIGLFKKASELCVICGANVAIIVFSPGQKVFSFGHPNVEAVIDRFLTKSTPPVIGTQRFIVAHRDAAIKELNTQFSCFEEVINTEKKSWYIMEEVIEDRETKRWWETSTPDMLSMQQLRELASRMASINDFLGKYCEKRNLIIEPVVTSGNTNTVYGSSSRGFNIVPSEVNSRPLASNANTSMVPYDATKESYSRDVVSYDARTSGYARARSNAIVPGGPMGSLVSGGPMESLDPTNTTRASGDSASDSFSPFNSSVGGVVPFDPRGSGSMGATIAYNASEFGIGGSLPFDFLRNNSVGDDRIRPSWTTPPPNFSASGSGVGVSYPPNFSTSGSMFNAPSPLGVFQPSGGVHVDLMAGGYDPNASGSSSNSISFGNGSSRHDGGSLFDICNASLRSSRGVGTNVNEFNVGLTLDVISASGFTMGNNDGGAGGGMSNEDIVNVGGNSTDLGAQSELNGRALIVGGASNDLCMERDSNGRASIVGDASNNIGMERESNGRSVEEVPFDNIASGANGYELYDYQDDIDFF